MHVNSLIDLDQNFNLVASKKYQSDLDADRYISEASARISTNFKWTTFTYMNILNMRTKILCHRNENEINQKFVCLKVASINTFNKSGYIFPYVDSVYYTQFV
jgi:hypothetical protein